MQIRSRQMLMGPSSLMSPGILLAVSHRSQLLAFPPMRKKLTTDFEDIVVVKERSASIQSSLRDPFRRYSTSYALLERLALYKSFQSACIYHDDGHFASNIMKMWFHHHLSCLYSCCFWNCVMGWQVGNFQILNKVKSNPRGATMLVNCRRYEK